MKKELIDNHKVWENKTFIIEFNIDSDPTCLDA